MTENNFDSEDDGWFAISEDLVQSPQHKAAGASEIDFDGLLSTPLRLHEDLKNGCGGQLWPAGMVLSKYLLRSHKESFKDKTVCVLSVPPCEMRKKLIFSSELNLVLGAAWSGLCTIASRNRHVSLLIYVSLDWQSPLVALSTMNH